MDKYDFEFNIQQYKKNDKKYLKELQLFFDKVDRIKDEELKMEILRQMHICEQRLILMCNELFNKLTKG